MAYQQQLSVERLWNVAFGPEVAYGPTEMPLVVSMCYYAATMVFGRLLRATNRAITPLRYQVYVFDAITTFQVCACSIENIMIRRSYGVGGYTLILFALAVWFSFTIKEGRGNICGSVCDYVYGYQGLKRTVLRCAAQLAGGVASYRYAQTFWYMGLTAGHGQRYNMLYCTAGLTAPSPIGMGLESVSTFIETFLALSTFTSFFASEIVTKCAVSTTMTIMGVHLTGMYLNPVNAFNQEFGCVGVSPPIHFLVYWVGPITAAAAATVTHRYLHQLLKSTLSRDAAVLPKGQQENGPKKQENGRQSPSKKSDKSKYYQNRGSPRKATLRNSGKKEKSN